MKNSFKNILINSSLAFVSAFIITTFIHELSHYLAHLIFGADPTLFHNYVQTAEGHRNITAGVVSALAGPVMSLLQGIFFTFLFLKKKNNSAINLLLLWISLLGYVNFFGYLVMTPFFISGDTGKAAELLNLDYYIRFLIALIGFIILILIIFNTGKNFSYFIPEENDLRVRSKYIYHVMFFPIIIGSLINSILAFPVVVLLSVIYPATSSYVIMSSFGAILKTTIPVFKSEIEDKINYSLLIIFIGSIILNRLLTFGVG